MTKADLARTVYERHGGISIREAARLVDIIFDRVRETLLKGEPVNIVGFGSFEVVTRQAKTGRNLNTGEPIAVAKHRAVVFRPSRSFRLVLDGQENPVDGEEGHDLDHKTGEATDFEPGPATPSGDRPKSNLLTLHNQE